MSQHLSDGISPVELKADGATVSPANPLPITGTITVSNPTANPETGLAKEITLGSVKTAVEVIQSGQLPDGHNVTISNPGDIGGGTQYTEDAVAQANPVGTALNLIAIDTPANEVAAGDNVSARGTRKGEVYVKHIDPLPAGTNNIGDVDVLSLPALPAGTNLVGSVILDRPSQGPTQTYKVGQVDAITADTQVYDVTAGKTLYIHSWGASFHNTSTVGMGHVRLRDGNATGTIIASWVLPTAVVGVVAPHSAFTALMIEPKQFTDAVFIDVVTGMITISFQFTGYEQ